VVKLTALNLLQYSETLLASVNLLISITWSKTKGNFQKFRNAAKYCTNVGNIKTFALIVIYATYVAQSNNVSYRQRLSAYISFVISQNTFHATVLQRSTPTYIYLTVQHLDSWIKRDQLDVTCFIISLFTAQHVSDVNTSILRSLWLICWVISWVVLLWYDACWCYVVVWLLWCGIRMQAEALL